MKNPNVHPIFGSILQSIEDGATGNVASRQGGDPQAVARRAENTPVPVLRLSCVVCTKPDQPVIATHAGRAPICAACLAVLEPSAVHPDGPSAPYWNMDRLRDEADDENDDREHDEASMMAAYDRMMRQQLRDWEASRGC